MDEVEYIYNDNDQEPQPREEYFSVTGCYDKALAKAREENPRRQDVFHCSDMGSSFHHRYLRRLGIPEKQVEPRIQRVFETGNAMHDNIQRHLEAMGVVVCKEGIVGNDFIEGHFDLLVADPALGNVYNTGECLTLVDIKTVHSGKFTHMKSRGFEDAHYRAQIHSYCYFLRKHGYTDPVTGEKHGPFPGLSDCRILYVSKDDSRWMEIGVPYTERSEIAITKELNQLKEYWDKQQLPPSDPMQEWERKYCPFPTVCPCNQAARDKEEERKIKKAQKAI